MIKKIICQIEDVRDFAQFSYKGDTYIKVLLLQHRIVREPVPWDLKRTIEFKANCYRVDFNCWSFIKDGSEVSIIPTKEGK